jgi:hypothetical protein
MARSQQYLTPWEEDVVFLCNRVSLCRPLSTIGVDAGEWDRGLPLGFGVALPCLSYRACDALSQPLLPLLPSPAPFVYARHYGSSSVVAVFALLIEIDDRNYSEEKRPLFERIYRIN